MVQMSFTIPIKDTINYGHSPPSADSRKGGLLSVISETMITGKLISQRLSRKNDEIRRTGHIST